MRDERKVGYLLEKIRRGAQPDRRGAQPPLDPLVTALGTNLDIPVRQGHSQPCISAIVSNIEGRAIFQRFENILSVSLSYIIIIFSEPGQTG